MHLVFFEQELLDLQQELSFHPELLQILAEQPDKDIYISISEIAKYLGIILHGDYTKQDILKICSDMTVDLQKKRTIHVDSLENKLVFVQNLDGLEH